MSRIETIGNATLYLGDCRDILRTLPAESVDSIVTDPPYELGFMGKAWDGTGIANDVGMWREVLRVLKPGAHLLAFSGSRTYHRMVCAIEDAGFEIRDQIMWLYGSGFPKSLDVSKAIDRAAGKLAPEGQGFTVAGYSHNPDKLLHTAPSRGYVPPLPATPEAERWQGWGTALKPAHEPIVVARKPLIGTVAANVLAHGTGALNIDGCRVGTTDEWQPSTRGASDSIGTFRTGERTTEQHALGRWPANLIHDGSDEVLAAFPTTTSGAFSGHRNDPKTKNAFGSFALQNERGHAGDTGSAARFFYCAKASRADRNAGLYSHENVIISLECQQENGEWVQEDQLARLLVDTGQSPPKVIGASGIASKNAIEWSTSWFGSRLTAPFRPDLMCTTETATNSTTGLTTLSYFLSWLISESTAVANCGPMDGGSRVGNAANGTTSIITTNEKMASALGVVLAPSKTRLRISVSAAVSDHPTVKPTALMRYLVRLVTPPGGTVLDPFTGSGSTGRACALEGMQFIGCELDPAYVDIACRRIEDAQRQPRLIA